MILSWDNYDQDDQGVSAMVAEPLQPKFDIAPPPQVALSSIFDVAAQPTAAEAKTTQVELDAKVLSNVAAAASAAATKSPVEGRYRKCSGAKTWAAGRPG